MLCEGRSGKYVPMHGSEYCVQGSSLPSVLFMFVRREVFMSVFIIKACVTLTIFCAVCRSACCAYILLIERFVLSMSPTLYLSTNGVERDNQKRCGCGSQWYLPAWIREPISAFDTFRRIIITCGMRHECSLCMLYFPTSIIPV